MIKFLVRIFIKERENTSDISVREKYSVLGGILGIICNIFLFALKIVIGSMMNSIAIISDAFNNFSDIASSVVTVLGAKLSVRKEDREHPFGHGRYEYIARLVVSFIILSVGIELLKASASKIFNPGEVYLNGVLLVILIASVLIKVWMFSYNRYLGKKINSKLLMAAAQDSLNDVVSTLGIIGATVLGKFLPFGIDGYIGLIVSVFILYSGYLTAKDTIGTLLGSAPSAKLYEEIKKTVLSGKDIKDIHDLVIHDYGPGRTMATIHAEVPSECNLLDVHETVDEIESDISRRLGVNLVIHVDPIIHDGSRYSKTKDFVSQCALAVDENISIHDFKMVEEEDAVNLIFDLAIPAGTDEKEQEKIILDLNNKIKAGNPRYTTAIKVDYIYL